MKKILLFFISAFIVYLTFLSCSSSKSISKVGNNNRRMILRDEGSSQLSHVDIANPTVNWHVPVPAGRDLQIVGGGRVLIGTGNGYEEREIATGKKVFEITTFPGTVAARRLKNGNTLLTGVNWQGKLGIVLVELNKSNTIQAMYVYPEFNYVRLTRETVSGNFLITADDTVFEGTADGRIIWQAKTKGIAKPHAWQALRLGKRTNNCKHWL